MTAHTAETTVRTTCPYCGVGCGVIATPRADGTVAIAGDPEHPANFGRLCSKGAALGETLSLADRLLAPEIDGIPTSWDVALALVADTLSRTIAEHGPESVAFYGSGQLLTEDYYVANKLMKGFIGSANIDTNSRLCMASAVSGHKRAFGSDTVPGCYEDFELADLVVLVGSNLAWCHPVLYQRLAAAKALRPEMRVVLIDPRRTATADIADLHLPIRPDGDTVLFAGLLNALAGRGALDASFVAAHTSGLSAALGAVADLTTEAVAGATRLDPADVATFFAWFAGTDKVVTAFSQGVNQSAGGTDKVNAIINCHVATGRIGRPGCGPFSVTGQPNAMGGREVGGLANVLAAHMDFDPASIDRVSRFWRSDRVATKPGLKAVDLFEAVGDGRIKALWIMATNPVDSMPEADRVREALRRCPFVVVSDVSARTDTIAEAHVRLPAAGWGEKDGTVTNSERRISRQRAFLPTPGEARPDWWIVSEVARRMGHGHAFPYSSAGEIFAEHVALSAFENSGTRDFDLGSLSRANYAQLVPGQWPAGRQRLFADGQFFTPDRRARFVPYSPAAAARPSPARSFTLNTGRVRDHWHTMTRTGKTARLSSHIAEPFAELHPDDARDLGVATATLVRLENKFGAVLVRALITARQQRGSVFVPMHWTNQFAAAGRVDALVRADFCPHSGQPALKMGRVAVSPADIGCYGFAVSRRRPEPGQTPYWAAAAADGGWRLELGWQVAPISMEAWARDAFKVPAAAPLVSSVDAASGRSSLVCILDGVLEFALWASREPVAVARQWASTLLSTQPENGWDLLAGRPGPGFPDVGPTVCACFGVGAVTITDAARDGCLSVEAIGEATKAGTNCGSCRPEIRALLRSSELSRLSGYTRAQEPPPSIPPLKGEGGGATRS